MESSFHCGADLGSQFSDVVLLGSSFSAPAHRLVLAARSSVLAEALRLSQTPGLRHIELPACVPEDALRITLRWMYTDKLDEGTLDPELLLEVHAIGLRWRLARLCARVSRALHVRTLRNAAEVCALLTRADALLGANKAKATLAAGLTSVPCVFASSVVCAAAATTFEMWAELSGGTAAGLFGRLSMCTRVAFVEALSEWPLHLAAAVAEPGADLLALLRTLAARHAEQLSSGAPRAGEGLRELDGRAQLGGRVPLSIAASCLSAQSVDELIRCGASVRAPDPDGTTPLHAALMSPPARRGSPRATRRAEATIATLLASGARVNALDSAGRSPLDVCAARLGRGVAHLLLAHGARAAQPEELDVRLRDAAGAGDAPLVAALLGVGADGRPAAGLAGSDGQVAPRAALGGALDAQDESGRTPLHHAAERGHAAVCSLLLRVRARPDVAEDLGRTPLHLTCAAGHLAIAALLLGERAPALGAAPSGASPALVASRAARPSNPLLHMGDSCGRTALFLSVESPALLEALVGWGASVRHRDAEGATALHAAARSPDPLTSLELLLAAGADAGSLTHPVAASLRQQQHAPLAASAGARRARASALHVLCRAHTSSDERTVRAAVALARAGCPLDARDGAGETALHIALSSGALALAASLVECGARLNVPDHAGRTALRGLPLAAQHAVLSHVSIAPDWTTPPMHAGSADGAGSLIGAAVSPRSLSASQASGEAEPSVPAAAACQECDVPFELKRRRHHCRHCGRALCAACSAEKAAIPKFGLITAVRVCAQCKHALSVV